MKHLIEYSALNTKIRAMHAKLLTKEDFLSLCECKDVPEVISMLESFPQYQSTFSKISAEKIHREEVERLLLLNKYDDFSKIYRFSNQTQRKFLELFFMHYEVAMLKKILRHCLSSSKSFFNFQSMKEFYLKHSNLDFEKLLLAENMQEFVDALHGSYYEKDMIEAKKKNSNIFEYETLLDQLYFRRIWSEKDTLNRKIDVEIFTTLVGTRIDLLNVLWIYRSKKFYHLNSTQMQTLIIPIFSQLKKQTINKLIDADTLDDFEQLFSSTYYGKKSRQSNTFEPNTIFHREMQNIYMQMKKQNPNSIAILSSYLYEKEKEVDTLISLIESVRYGLSPKEIQSTLFNQGRRTFQT